MVGIGLGFRVYGFRVSGFRVQVTIVAGCILKSPKKLRSGQLLVAGSGLR